MKLHTSIAAILSSWLTLTSAAEFIVRISPAAQDAKYAILTVNAPQDFPVTGVLTGAGGSIPFQKNAQGDITFITPLKKGEALSLKLNTGEKPSERMTAARDDGRVLVKAGEKLVFAYQGEESALPRPDIKPQFKRGGYIHPVLSPSGKQVTDDYPPNHIHHHGIWFPWTKTVFEGRSPDFWNMGESKGKVEFVKFGGHWSGPVHAGFVADHRFIDLTSGEPKPALNETWTVQAYAIPGADYFVFDLTSVQTCATSAPLELPKYHYGGLGFRGNWAWNGEDKGHFLTSNGETDRVKGNETRGTWCHMGGEVEGAFTGVAILGHPANFRAPQPMRLHPKEPFFCFAPSQLGDWSIQPGKPYISRYRFIVKDGRPNKQELDALWSLYAEPPGITIQQIN